jgi:phytoene synthase
VSAPAEPRLQAIASELRPRGISGRDLSQLEDAWLPLLEAFPWGKAQTEGLALRGRILFGIGARLLGATNPSAVAAGEFWSVADGARHCTDPQSHELLIEKAKSTLAAMPGTMPRPLRPLTILAALAAADLVGRGRGLSRLSAAVRHQLFGTLPR